jgi:hypothetical protein
VRAPLPLGLVSVDQLLVIVQRSLIYTNSFEEYDRAAPTNRERCPMCRGSTLNADGRLFANVRNENGFTGAIDLGEDLDTSQFEDSQPDSWKRGQALLSLCECSEFDDAEALLRDEGTDPNAAYEDGTTGLHMAAYNNSIEWARLCMSPPLHIFSNANRRTYESTAIWSR